MRRVRDSLLGVAVPLLIAALVVVGELLEGPTPQLIGVLCAVPLLAAALTSPLQTALVGLVVTLCAVRLGYVQTTPDGSLAADSTGQQVRLALLALFSILAVPVSYARLRRAQTGRRLSSVADAAQQAIMRPIPAVVGGLRCSALYQSATSEARIGGDLIEVLATPFGTRALVGDVRGKGMEAVQKSGVVLGAFREVGYTEPTLSGLAMALNRAVLRDAGPEDFVTVALLQMQPDGDLQVCSCGHPAPLLVRATGEPATELEIDPVPPLGLLTEAPRSTFSRLAHNQRLVLVTDGVLEARSPRRWWMRGPWRGRGGEFFPAERVIGRELSRGTPADGLRRVAAAAHGWTGDSMSDDMAILVLERERGTAQRPATPRTSSSQAIS